MSARSTQTYLFATLDTRDTPEAVAADDVFGINMLTTELAAQCNRGGVRNDCGHAAIQQAWNRETLPPFGTTLVTPRADLGSVGAMAILTIRRRTDGRNTRNVAFIKRMKAIAKADKEIDGYWPGQRTLTSADEFVGPLGPLEHVITNIHTPLAERVDTMIEWLRTGTFENEAQVRAYLVDEVVAAFTALDATVRVERHGDIAVVVGSHSLAIKLGYRLAPVVVATNPKFHFEGDNKACVKHTVAYFHPDWLDWDGLKAALNHSEPGWGGGSSTMGSPLGKSSMLTTNQVADLVAAYLLP